MGVAASSCSSSSKKYEVFLSFRGEDTRRSFTSHLYDALCRSGIETYIDDGIPKGDDISQALIHAIENSSISIVIFSENYASSKWCLNELIEILRCKQHQKQHVVPIFYQVDPAHVRKHMGAYEEAFAQHLKNYPEKVNRWRQALFEIASLGGWDSHNFSAAGQHNGNLGRENRKDSRRLEAKGGDCGGKYCWLSTAHALCSASWDVVVLEKTTAPST